MQIHEGGVDILTRMLVGERGLVPEVHDFFLAKRRSRYTVLDYPFRSRQSTMLSYSLPYHNLQYESERGFEPAPMLLLLEWPPVGPFV
jgi:hypothetical protein